ncbi:phosphotransferase family protein [Pseudonocardia broussonetiae]|uniref:Phosphotransferase family protein n=1 Tax=Pseudonocardia broussonetiae TaxID=2736640 RepID=A0A6M6JN64_9PSEU|nr:phosphotransferase family protein [Pseudonocardia broussonetiae]QJY48062.1 phosphotransferase family protein [Pseudonocardia broussonetiae]
MADHTPGVDGAAVRRWLTRHGHAPAGGLSLRRVGLGQSNLTYRVADERGQVWVLRRPPLGRLLDSAHDVLREARILTALRDTDVPVPVVHGVVEPGEVGDDDAPAFVMSWVDGAVVDRMPLAEELAPGYRRSVALSLARTLAAVHRVDLDAAGLAGLAGRTPYAARQLRRWSAQWERSRTADLPALDALTRRLTGAAPEQHETTLVHGDFHLRNMIVAPGSGEVVAVLDWELSTLGHPLADLGSLLAYWVEPGEEGLDDFVPSTLPGFPSRTVLVEEYAGASGRDTSAIGYWHALGLWKLAVIAQGVLRRAQDDPRNRASEGTPTGAGIARLVDRAHAVADTAGL